MIRIFKEIRKYFVYGILAITAVVGIYKFNSNMKGETTVEAFNAISGTEKKFSVSVTYGSTDLPAGNYQVTIEDFLTETKWRSVLYGVSSSDGDDYSSVGWFEFGIKFYDGEDDNGTVYKTYPLGKLVNEFTEGALNKYNLYSHGYGDVYGMVPDYMYYSGWDHRFSESISSSSSYLVSYSRFETYIRTNINPSQYIFGNDFYLQNDGSRYKMVRLNRSYEYDDTTENIEYTMPSKRIYNSTYYIKSFNSNSNRIEFADKTIQVKFRKENLNTEYRNENFKGRVNGIDYEFEQFYSLNINQLISNITFSIDSSKYYTTDSYLYYNGNALTNSFYLKNFISDSALNHYNLSTGQLSGSQFTLYTNKDAIRKKMYTASTNNSSLRIFANGADVTGQQVEWGTGLTYQINGQVDYKNYSISNNPSVMPTNDFTANLSVSDKQYQATFAGSGYTLSGGSVQSNFNYIYNQNITLPNATKADYDFSHYVINGTNYLAGAKFPSTLKANLTITPVFNKKKFLVSTNNSNVKVYANNAEVTGKQIEWGTALTYEIINKVDYKTYSLSGNYNVMPKQNMNVVLTIKDIEYAANFDKTASYTLKNGNVSDNFKYVYGQEIILPNVLRTGYTFNHYEVNGKVYQALEKLDTTTKQTLTIVPVFDKVVYNLNNVENEVYSLIFENSTANIGDTVKYTFTLNDKGYTLNYLKSDAIKNGSAKLTGSFVLSPKDNNPDLIFEIDYHANTYTVYYATDLNNISDDYFRITYKDNCTVVEAFDIARDILGSGYYLSNFRAYSYNKESNQIGEEIVIDNAFEMPSNDVILIGEPKAQKYTLVLNLDRETNYTDKDGKVLVANPLYKDALDTLHLTSGKASEDYVIETDVESLDKLPVISSPYRVFKGWATHSNSNQFDNVGLTDNYYYKNAADVAISYGKNAMKDYTVYLYPYFEVVKANIKFMDEQDELKTKECYVNTALSTLEMSLIPQSSKGVFGGWYFDSEYLNEFVIGETLVPETLECVVYAKWLNSTYTATFVNWDGTVLESMSVQTFEKPVYSKENPTKPDDMSMKYQFAGWDKAIEPIRENTIYTAQYSFTFIEYGVQFFNEGELISSKTYHFNDKIVKPATPVKESTEQYDYVFDKWSVDTDLCTGNLKFYAIYKEVLRSYDITWNVNGNNIVVKYNYGETPSYEGNLEKKDTYKTYFEFTGWSPEITTVTKDATYTAIFEELDKVFNITFYDALGDEIKTVSYKYGEKVDMPTDFVSFALREDVKFAGWVDENNNAISNLINISQSLKAFPSFIDDNNKVVNDLAEIADQEEIKVRVEEISEIENVNYDTIDVQYTGKKFYDVARYIGDRKLMNADEGANVTIDIAKEHVGTYHVFYVNDDNSLTEINYDSVSSDGINLSLNSLGRIIVTYDDIPTISLASAIRIASISSIILGGLCVVVFVKTRHKNSKIAKAGKED